MLTRALARLKPFDVVPAKGSRKLAFGSAIFVPPPNTTNPVMEMLNVSGSRQQQDGKRMRSQHEGKNFNDSNPVWCQNGNTVVENDHLVVSELPSGREQSHTDDSQTVTNHGDTFQPPI